MSTDNVTPIHISGQPPKSPRKQKREPRQKWDLRFGRLGDKGSYSLTIWQGLLGVCRELDELGGTIDEDLVNRYGNLGAAAHVLAELLENRMML